MKSLQRTPQIPAGWYDMFISESHPALVPPDRWPSLFEVIHHLEAAGQAAGKAPR